MTFSSVRHIHFVGIGGSGMSGIAEILLSQGFTVSGSDLSGSATTEHLTLKGASIFIGHSAENIHGAEVVVYSSAVKPLENPETMAALERKIPVIRRAEMLSEVSRLKYTLAIAGTHGKTTTTSMCGLVMMKAGLDPTVIVGGRLTGLGGSNARLGTGDWVVLEADEYDRSFLQLLPTIAVITNIEADHLDIYSDLDDIKGAFTEFSNKVPFYGAALVCLDDPGVRDVMPHIKRVTITYGTTPQCDVRASNIAYSERSSSYDLAYRGEPLGRITLNVPGEHNVLNSLAACGVALQCGVPAQTIQQALAEFGGVYRRFEIKGETSGGILVIDDYAHHPTEILATLEAARKGWDRRIVAVFQPHTYTRTRDFYREFATSFDNADVIVLTDVYAAREEPIEGVSGRLIADAARDAGHRHVFYAETLNDVSILLEELLRPGDILLTMGAGDVWRVGSKVSN
ncbi:MAG: UDP-N-acetylmuramate--L-alanine ligase [Candidatus Kapabacteria bacterium]|nr:UDP-N-acetylmuramate--L-alanine ligase [Candidatus Kapabacteria bacterium]